MVENIQSDLEIEEEAQKGRILTFSLGAVKYGVEIKYVKEIVGIQKITKIPGQPDYVKGVINLRGKIIPTMDVRIKFNKGIVEYDNRTCIIVVNIEGVAVGLIVDRVLEVVVINDENISKPPNFNNDFSNRYVKGIGRANENIIIILECITILNDDEIRNVNNIEK